MKTPIQAAQPAFRVSASLRPSHGPLMHRLALTGSIGGQQTAASYTVHLLADRSEIWVVTDSDGRPTTAAEIAQALFLPPAAAATIQSSIDNALWYQRESARPAGHRGERY